jgi:hypothetical protein
MYRFAVCRQNTAHAPQTSQCVQQDERSMRTYRTWIYSTQRYVFRCLMRLRRATDLDLQCVRVCRHKRTIRHCPQIGVWLHIYCVQLTSSAVQAAPGWNILPQLTSRPLWLRLRLAMEHISYLIAC